MPSVLLGFGRGQTVVYEYVNPSRMRTDISPEFRWNKTDAKTIRKILPHEGTPEAIQLFSRYAWRLTDYAYWFVLSTLWVSCTDGIDLEEWRRLFSSLRSSRDTSIMKPSELEIFRALDDSIILYRAHRPGELDWINYSLSARSAAEFALRRGVDKVSEYRVDRADVLCFFLRRGEFEVLVLDKAKAAFIREISVALDHQS